MSRLLPLTFAAALAAGASAQVSGQSTEITTTTTTRVELDGGRDVTLVGCLGRSPDGSMFMLTNVGTTTGALKSYYLVVDDEDESEANDLAKYVGQKVEIEGKVSDEGDARVKTSTKTEVERPGPDRETETRGEMEGDLKGIPFLGVDEVKRIATACP